MSALVKLGTGIVAIIAMGWLATGTILAKPGRPCYERVATGFMVGTGLLSMILFWVSLFLAGYAVLAGSVLASAGLLMLVLRACRPRDSLGRLLRARDRFVEKWRGVLRLRPWPAVGLLSALVVALCAIAVIAFGTGLGWDGVAIWSLKARIFSLDGGVSRSYFHDVSRQWSHLDYPLLVPLTEAWLYSILGSINEELIKVLFLAFYVSLLLMFHGALRRRFSLPYSLGFTLLLCLMPAMVAMGTSGYADLPLGAFVFGSTAFLYSWLAGRDSTDLFMAGVLSTLAVWTKREGLVVWLLQLSALILCLARERKQPALGRIKLLAHFLLPAALLVPWFLFLAHEHVPSNDFGPLSLQRFLRNLGRLPILGRILAAQLLSLHNWGILWILFLSGPLFPSPQRMAPGDMFLFLFPIAYLLLMTGSFVFSAWQPFESHVLSSIDRLVLQVAPVAMFYVAHRVGSSLSSLWPALMDRGSQASAARNRRQSASLQ